jgi:nucleoside-diphosphate-sugar epimerase
MKVLIIGGTGLISTPITRMLSERGDDVTLYNRAKRQSDLPAGVRQMIGDRTEHAAFEAQMQAAARSSTAWVAARPISTGSGAASRSSCMATEARSGSTTPPPAPT